MAWVDLKALLPGLRGVSVHVVPRAAEARLRNALREAGFDVRVIDGRRVRDAEGLLAALARALELAPHFGHNWDALNDALGERILASGPPLAVVWRHADRSLEADLQLVLDAARAFDAASAPAPDAEPVGQMELFLVGEGAGFAQSGWERAAD
jgi:RNAse (barnase) inhibitor barstar